MNDFEITELPDGTFDLHLGADLLGNFPTQRRAIRVAVLIHRELVR
jgi:hypothetical protein